MNHSDPLTFQSSQEDIRISLAPPLSEQKIMIEGVIGLRMLLDMVFSTWRQGGDFQIIFTAPGGTFGPTVTFQKPKEHKNWAADILKVVSADGVDIASARLAPSNCALPRKRRAVDARSRPL